MGPALLGVEARGDSPPCCTWDLQILSSQHPVTAGEPDLCSRGWGTAMGTSRDTLGAPACRQASGEKFIFVGVYPLVSGSIKGPESSLGPLPLSMCCYSWNQARP